MGCVDPNDYIGPQRPEDVSARPEWPNIITSNYGWNCGTVTRSLGGPLGYTPGKCCMYVVGGQYSSQSECVQKTNCEDCREPEEVLDWANRKGIYDSTYVGKWSIPNDNGEYLDEQDGMRYSYLYMFVYRHFAPVDFYYIGDHNIYGSKTGYSMDPDKDKHTYVSSIYEDCDRQGNNCVPIYYGYSAKRAYAPRTLYQQFATRFVGFDTHTLQQAGDFTRGDHEYLWQYSKSSGEWKEARAEHLDMWGHSRPVYDQNMEQIGSTNVYTEYDPWHYFYPDYTKNYSYADWARINEDERFNPSAFSIADYPNNSLVQAYISGDAATRADIEWHYMHFDEVLEWYNFLENQIEPPGWVEGGYPTFYKSNRYTWAGQFNSPLEKIMRRRTKFYEGVTLRNINSNLKHLRSGQESRFGAVYPNETWRGGDNYRLRGEKYEDRMYINDGCNFVLENKETGKVTFTSIPMGVQGMSSHMHPNETVKVLNPIFDDVYTGLQSQIVVDEETGEEVTVTSYGNSLWGSLSGTHCFDQVFSVDGAYPLYINPECAYKHDPEGEYLERYFLLKTKTELQGDRYKSFKFYQPKSNSTQTGARYDGDLPGGNGYYYSFTKPLEDWVSEHPEIPPDNPDLFIPFKPTSGPSSVVLEKGIVIPVPTSGPSSPSIISGVVLPPENGPYRAYTLTDFFIPTRPRITTGPTGIAVTQTVPVSGPTSAVLIDRSNPPTTGPATTVLLETLAPPYYGPETIIVVELPPAAGPRAVSLIELAPSTGPINTDPIKLGTTIYGVTYLIPTSGPVSLYGNKAQPLSGPDSIVTDLLPATGPTNTEVRPGDPVSGPTGISSFKLQEPYDCFGGTFWFTAVNTYRGDFNATIRGLRSGAQATYVTASITPSNGNRWFKVDGGNANTQYNDIPFEVGETVQVTGSSYDFDGYYVISRISSFYSNYDLYVECDGLIPFSGPSSSVVRTVSHEEFPLPTTGPSSLVADAMPSTGPSSVETSKAPPLSAPKTLTTERLVVDTIDSFFTYTNGFTLIAGSYYEDMPANMAFHPFLYSIRQFSVGHGQEVLLSGLGSGRYNINKQGDHLTFDNPFNYSHSATVTVNPETGKNMYAYSGFGTVTVNCTPLVGASLVAGQGYYTQMTNIFSDYAQSYRIDETPHSLVNCSLGSNQIEHGGWNSKNWQPRMSNYYSTFTVTPTTSGTCSLTYNMRDPNTQAVKLRATLTWDVI